MAQSGFSGAGLAGAAVPREAFHVEQVVDPFTGDCAIGMVRHAGHPWVARQTSHPAPRDHAAWQALGAAYLAALQARLGLVPGQGGWLHPGPWAALQQPRGHDHHGFAWLDISWDEPVEGSQPLGHDGPSPLGSFWVSRRAAAGADGPRQRSLVLLAGSVNQAWRLQFGMDFGLRLVLHLHRGEVRVHGLTLAGLASDRVAQVLPHDPFAKPEAWMLTPLKHAVGLALDCEGYVWISSLERTVPGSDQRLRARGHALRLREVDQKPDRSPRPRVHDYCVELEWQPAQRLARVVQVHRNQQVGSAGAGPGAPCWPVFLRDPASAGPADSRVARRPTRSEAQLAAFTRSVALPLAPSGGLSIGPAGAPFAQTTAASPGSAAAGTMPTAPGPGVLVQVQQAPALMSDAHGALQTHAHAKELFDRIEASGVDPHAMFRFARLPLLQRVRPAMRWAPDGELPNAEVRPVAGARGDRLVRAEDRLQLLVMYGSASPFHRRELPVQPAAAAAVKGWRRRDRRRMQYLSVACDPRWAWHEFGHVLAYASTGELELPFAHGAGDALAAIATDPLSALADPADPEAPARFATFPWIEVPGRSHGRSAWRGYCWCGLRNQVRLVRPGLQERYHHSYFGEQLMSSSLFRLYRSLGGDTFGDDPTDATSQGQRLEASDYCIYLVMQAISLLGPDSIAPARTADQWVSALIDADLGTGEWQLEAGWPLDQASARRLRRRGGQVHKVIRWAFERQGLYATDDPRATADGPGRPPAADVYLADARPLTGPDAEPGGYAPVPLRWLRGDGSLSTQEPWQAAADAVRRQGRQVRVVLGQRGGKPAAAVRLRLWWSSPQPGQALQWHAAGPARGTRAEPVGETVLTLPKAAPAEPLWLLVVADAAADPSNLAVGDTLPDDPLVLMALVAHDNNIALAWR